MVFTAPIGERVDAGAWDSTTKTAFVSTGDGKVFAFRQDSRDSYSLAKEIVTKPVPKLWAMTSEPSTS